MSASHKWKENALRTFGFCIAKLYVWGVIELLQGIRHICRLIEAEKVMDVAGHDNEACFGAMLLCRLHHVRHEQQAEQRIGEVIDLQPMSR